MIFGSFQRFWSRFECFLLILGSFVYFWSFSYMFLLFLPFLPRVSWCFVLALSPFMIKRNKNYEASPLCLSDEDNLEPVTIFKQIDFACRKGSTVW